MANTESVKMGSAVAPAEPAEALDADTAEPGEVSEAKAEEMQRKAAKRKATAGPPVQKQTDEEQQSSEDEPPSWIEIVLKDEDGKTIPGEPYRVKTADGKIAAGTLDHKGYARIDGIKPGTCKVCFPNIDEAGWSKA